MMASKYKMFLKDLADHLTSGDADTIKFLFGSELPAGKAERINTQMQLLNAMDRAEIISRTDVTKLEFLFNILPRKDLIPKLDKYKEDISNEPEETIGCEDMKELHEKEVKRPKELKMLHATENIDDSDSDALSPTEMNNLLTVSLDDDEESHSFAYSGPLEDFSAAPVDRRIGTELTPSLVTASLVTPAVTSPSVPPLITPLLTHSLAIPLTTTPIGTPSPGKIELMTPDFYRKTRSTSKSPNPERSPEYPPNPSRQRSSQQVRPEEYSMDRIPHGDCIIFSNRFDEPVTLPNGHVLNQRVGTEKDVLLLKETFEYLRFDVTIYRNQSAADLMNTLIRYANQKEQESKDCFVVCILSHGYDGGIYGNDGVMLSSKQLKTFFTGDNCPSLLNKPKLFFIQACQGETDGKGVRLLEADGPSTQIAQDHLGESGSDIVQVGVVLEEIISIDADFLFFMATTPGTISWRDPVRGSWFVQTLCEVFKQNAHCWSLMEMLLTVNNKIALMKQTFDDGMTMTMAKQMSDLGKNTLRKKLYFFHEREELGFNNDQMSSLLS